MLVERLEGGNRDLRLLVDSGMEFGATLDVDAVLRTVARAHHRGLERRLLRRLPPGRRRGRDPRRQSARTGTRTRSARGTRWRTTARSSEAVEQRRPVSCADILHDPRIDRDARSRMRRKWGYREQPRRAADQPRRRHRLHLADEPGDARPFAQRAGRGRPGAGREPGDRQRGASTGSWTTTCGAMALVSESALELTSSLDLQATLLADRAAGCARASASTSARSRSSRATELHTLMRVSRRRGGRGVDRAAAGARRRGRDPRGDRDEAAGGGRVAARPAAHAGRARDQQGLRAQELGHAAADRQGPRDRHRGARRERRRADLHAGGARHGGGDLPRRGARHRQRRAVRARAADDPRDAAAQRHRGADGRQPRPRRGRQGGRRRARPADVVRRVRPAAPRGPDGRHGHRLAPAGRGARSGSRSTTSSRVSSSASPRRASWWCACRTTCRRWPARRRSRASPPASSSRSRPTPACSACST